MEPHRANAPPLEILKPAMQNRQPVADGVAAMERDDETRLEAFLAQALHRPLRSCGRFSRSFQRSLPADVVELAGAIDRDSNAHFVRLEHPDVCVVDESAVGLDGVVPEL